MTNEEPLDAETKKRWEEAAAKYRAEHPSEFCDGILYGGSVCGLPRDRSGICPRCDE